MQCPGIAKSDFDFYNTVEQSDIAPTLAALLGFPIPKNNLGIIISDFVELWKNEEDQYKLLYENAKQVTEIAKATFPASFENPCGSVSPSIGDEIACVWDKMQETHVSCEHSDVALQNLRAYLSIAQRALSSTASNYDTTKLLIGIALCLVAATLSGVSVYHLSHFRLFEVIIFNAINISYGITMFASSYVEEEHQFFYWVTTGYLSLLYAKSSRAQKDPDKRLSSPVTILIVILLFGIVRRWNQTGQKYAGDPDLLNEVIKPHLYLLWVLIIITYSVFSRNLSQRATKWMQSESLGLLPVLVAMSALIFKIAFTAADAPELVEGVSVLRPLVMFTYRYPLVNLARVCFVGLVQLLACAIYYDAPWKSRAHLHEFLRAFQDILTLFLLTQSRTVNIPLFLIFYIQIRLLENNTLSVMEIATTSVLLQFASFFALGGTNAISSVDLSNAYNGVSGYNVLAVGMLTFLSNWAGPVWWECGDLSVDRW